MRFVFIQNVVKIQHPSCYLVRATHVDSDKSWRLFAIRKVFSKFNRYLSIDVIGHNFIKGLRTFWNQKPNKIQMLIRQIFATGVVIFISNKSVLQTVISHNGLAKFLKYFFETIDHLI